MYQPDDLPELGSDLVSALAGLHVHDFPHLWMVGLRSESGEELHMHLTSVESMSTRILQGRFKKRASCLEAVPQLRVAGTKWTQTRLGRHVCSCPSSVTVKTVVPVVPPVWRRKGRQTGGQRPRRKMRAGFSEVKSPRPRLNCSAG